MKDRPGQLNGVTVPYDASLLELKEMLHCPPPHCWVAYVALGHSSTQESLRLLAHQLSSSDPHVRRMTLEAIGSHDLAAQCESVILECFNDSASVVVRQACKTAASLGLDASHDSVFGLLDSKDESIRLAAIAALSELWQPTDFEKIQALFQKDRSEVVRKEAAWTLRRNALTDNARDLIRLWQSDSLPRHRSWACELAAEFALVEARQDLLALLDDPDGHVRHAARVAIDRLSDTTCR